jgi:PiT family inorganic phosphate transporter
MELHYVHAIILGLGTLMGGWRIVKTMGTKLCHLQPIHGFAAETSGAICLYGATWLGIPVSTTHTITGSIVSVGATRGPQAVAWPVAARVVWAWVLTITAAAAIAAASQALFGALGWNRPGPGTSQKLAQSRACAQMWE